MPRNNITISYLFWNISHVINRRKKKYRQVWSDNMGQKSDPEISPHTLGKGSDYTKITFSPDLAKFGMQSLRDGDILK